MIERSAGTAVMGYIVGGGYTGKTDELDKTIEELAGILQTLYSKDVEIRFNSHRESGGAWLKNSLPGFDGNCQVGMCAGLRAIRPESITDNDFFKQWRTLPKELYIATNINSSALKNPDICNSDGLRGDKYDYRYHTSIEKATQFLLDNIDVRKILS